MVACGSNHLLIRGGQRIPRVARAETASYGATCFGSRASGYSGQGDVGRSGGQRIYRLRVRAAVGAPAAPNRRRCDDHLAGRLHAVHTATAGRGRRCRRCTIRRDPTGGHAQGRARNSRPGGPRRSGAAPTAVHRSRTPHPRIVLGPIGADSRFGDATVRHSRIGSVRKGFEVDRRGAVSPRPRSASNWSCPAWKKTPELAQARRTIVVVGASYSGTELVLQLRALAHAAAKQMNFDPASVRFLLLDLAEQVMPEVGEKLGARAQRVLRQRGVDVRLGLTLNEVHPDHVILSDDSRVNAHTVAWVTGVTAAPLIETLGPTDRKGPAQGADRPHGARASGRLRRRRCGRGARRDPAGQDHPAHGAARDPARQDARPTTSQPASATVRSANTNTTTWGWSSTSGRTRRWRTH